MSEKMRFDGEVAIVTGAGNGLGRAYALLLGSRGAKVVVNDLGGDPGGDGSSAKPADRVVEEIRAAGGEAVASYDSVEEGAAIVERALESFGRVDILVNNAGILRDKSFHKMTEEDWKRVFLVHVLGSFRVTHAAWPHMREQSYGRIVMTSSAAGIYGNFGQANYSAAKLALLGLSNTLAREGASRNVLVNTIAPIAGSRLTATVLPDELVKALSPECVSPLVAYLCHQSCEESGGLFEVGGGFFAKLRWERTKGRVYRMGRAISPELLADHWNDVTSFADSTHPADIAGSMQPVLDNVNAGASKGGNELIDVDEALGYEFPQSTSSYDERDVALYALGVGAARDSLSETDLQLVYEGHAKGLRVLPTYGVVPAVSSVLKLAQEGKNAPGLRYGLDRILHGEQYLEVKRPLPPRAKLTHKAKVTDIFDKGKNALVVTEVRSYDETGEELVLNRLTLVIRGAGGWGGDRGPSDEANLAPKREPDKRTTEPLAENQALLYRLSGDWNPLHVDLDMARAFGFKRPILHGLCTLGFAVRHVIDAFCDGDPRYFKSVAVRFADSVYPGETLETEMWKLSDDRVVFQCRAKERDAVVLTRAAVELYREIPKPRKVEKKDAGDAGVPAAATVSPAAGAFAAIRAYLGANPGLVAKTGVVYEFTLKDPDGVWTLDLKNDGGAVLEGAGDAKPDCSLTLSTEDFLGMMRGELDPQALYLKGKLRISGNVMASQKLQFLGKVDMSAGEAPAGGPSPTASPAAAAAPRSPEIFAKLARHLNDNPQIGEDLRGSIRFEIRSPDSSWTLSLEDGVRVEEGGNGSADTTIAMDEEDLVRLTGGAASLQALFQNGKLRVDGDMQVAKQLAFLSGIGS